MADTYTLEAQPRTLMGKQVKQLRQQDLVPAVIYGPDSQPIHLTCARRALDIVLQKAGGTHLVVINIEGKDHSTLIREVQRDKIKRLVLHVDFLQVDLTKKFRTEVPLLWVNLPKLGADLMFAQNMNTIEIEALPTAIPEHIEVNLANLTTVGAKITVGDLPKLEGVDFLSDPHEVIVRVESLALRTDEEEVPVEGVVAEPEVIEKGKKEEEEF